MARSPHHRDGARMIPSNAEHSLDTESCARGFLNMPCSMRRTMTAPEAECELLARYEVPRAYLPGMAT
jgi:hypothetical protein